MSYQATIDPQAWVKNYSLSVDPPGETFWDCTNFIAENPILRREVDTQIATQGYFLDRDDELMGDRAKPDWVNDWYGPFTITVESKP